MEWKENAPLYIGVLIPIVMVIFIVASIYLPRFYGGNAPQYDFLYMTGDNFTVEGASRTDYSVQGGHLVQIIETPPGTQQVPAKPYPKSINPMHLFVYDSENDTSKAVTYEEAHALSLDPSRNSPDGFHVESGGRADVFPFNSGDFRDQILIGPHFRRELSLDYGTPDGFYSFQFLGWITDK